MVVIARCAKRVVAFQLDYFVTPQSGIRSDEHLFVITSPAGPGVVIELDGHGAERLAMTFPTFDQTCLAASELGPYHVPPA